MVEGIIFSADSLEWEYIKAMNRSCQFSGEELPVPRLGLAFSEVELAEVFAVGWQLMMYQRGEHLAELQEEPLARRVVVGVHGKFN